MHMFSGCSWGNRSLAVDTYLLSSRLAQLFSFEQIVVICFARIDKRNRCKMFCNERAYTEFAEVDEEITERIDTKRKNVHYVSLFLARAQRVAAKEKDNNEDDH